MRIPPEEYDAKMKALLNEHQKLGNRMMEIENHYKDTLLAHWGVKTGSIVKRTDRDKDSRYEVIGTSGESIAGGYRRRESRVWLLARKIKKDGTPSSVYTTLFEDWEIANDG